jgi:hypothetical protein
MQIWHISIDKGSQFIFIFYFSIKYCYQHVQHVSIDVCIDTNMNISYGIS